MSLALFCGYEKCYNNLKSKFVGKYDELYFTDNPNKLAETILVTNPIIIIYQADFMRDKNILRNQKYYDCDIPIVMLVGDRKEYEDNLSHANFYELGATYIVSDSDETVDEIKAIIFKRKRRKSSEIKRKKLIESLAQAQKRLMEKMGIPNAFDALQVKTS